MRPRCCRPGAPAPAQTTCRAGAPAPARRRAHAPAPASRAARAAAAAGLGSVPHVCAGAGQLRAAAASVAPSRRSRRRLEVTALVAVDYSQPAIWLGLGLIGGGLALYQLRRVQPLLSRDFDIVVSSVVIFSGGILIFQGWRLDPLLLFCQLLTAGTALAWALEAIKLRRLVENEQRFDERARRYPPLDANDGYGGSDGYGGGGRGIPLPPPREDDFGRWYAPEQAELYGEELPTASGQRQYGGYGPNAGSQEPWQGGGGGNYSRQPDDGGFYSPAEAPAARGSDALDPRWGPVDDVESFYRRPGAGSVTEDVARFYDGSGGGGEPPGPAQEPGAAGPRQQQQPPAADEGWQYYSEGEQHPPPDFPPPPASGGSSGGWQQQGPADSRGGGRERGERWQ